MRVTLVVPVKDEEASLGEFWDSVSAQTRPPDQILFVEAGSSDQTGDILERMRAGDSRVRILAAPGAYPGTARNLGIEAAEFPLIALADCGTILSPVWLAELLRAFTRDKDCEVAYGTSEPIHDGAVGRWGTITFLPPAREREGGIHRGETLRSLLLTRKTWSRVGPFPPWRAAEDLDFLDRLRASRVQAAVAPRAVAYWRAPSTVRATFQKLALYSCHNAWAGKQAQWHHGVARIYGVSVGAGVLAWLAARRRRPMRSIGASLALSVIARTTKRLWQARRSDPPWRLVRSGGALGVAMMILIGDVATFVGWLAALARKRPSIYRKQCSAWAPCALSATRDKIHRCESDS